MMGEGEDERMKGGKHEEERHSNIVLRGWVWVGRG